MRTTGRDQTGLVTFTGNTPGVTSATAQPGVPYTLTLVSTGTWRVNFDSALVPIAVIATPQATQVARVSSQAAGTFTVLTESPAGTLANGAFAFTCTARRVA